MYLQSFKKCNMSRLSMAFMLNTIFLTLLCNILMQYKVLVIWFISSDWSGELHWVYDSGVKVMYVMSRSLLSVSVLRPDDHCVHCTTDHGSSHLPVSWTGKSLLQIPALCHVIILFLLVKLQIFTTWEELQIFTIWHLLNVCNCIVVPSRRL